MRLNNKRLRYTYWLLIAFFRKNAQPIFLSFLGSIIAVIVVASFSPYLLRILTRNSEIIGVTGSYSVNNLPDDIVSKFSNGLLYVNDKGEIIPLLVDTWEQVDNGKEYRFHLKKDLTWNDGTPFTTKDVNYSFRDVKVVAENDYLLIITLKKELPIFPIFLSRPIVKFPLQGVAGLYRVDKVKTDQGIVKELHLSPNKEGLPYLVYKFYDTDTKLIQAYKLGEITQMSTNRPSVAATFESWKNSQIEKQVDYSQIVALFFNLDNSLLGQEKDLRHAIAESIDTTFINDLGEQAYSPIAPTSWAYNTDVKKYTYNPNVSERVIKKYTEDASSSAKLTISTYYDYLSVADTIKDNLKEVGLTVNVEVLAGNLPPTYQLFLAPMSINKDPDQYFFWHSTQSGNITKYNNPRIDKLLEDGRGTFSRNERKGYYEDFQKVLVEDMPAFFLYHPFIYTISRK
ncbi:ABC transporter substrate-binding protein [Candidatus Woesebacteria bacterium]|nr:ABC transporter substrate-binding protein [Candidatus Woesebacteria bacterium]